MARKKQKEDLDQIKNGQWVMPLMHGYKMQCCDCGLIHTLDFIVVDGEDLKVVNGFRVLMRAYREDKMEDSV